MLSGGGVSMPGWGRSLRARIGILLCAAALPASAISIASAISLYSTTVDLNDQALVDAARSVARRVEDETTQALRVARVLSAMPGSNLQGSLCDGQLEAVVEGSAVVRAAALVDPNGSIVCSAGIEEYAERAILLSASSEVGRLQVSGSTGASSVELVGRPGWRLAVAQPLISPIKAAIDAGNGGPEIGVVDGNWNPITNSLAPPTGKADEELSPSDRVGQTLRVTQGESVYRRAVVQIIRSNLFAVAFRPDPELIAQETAIFVGGIAAPLVTIAFTVIAAWFGIDRLALRWIRYLRRLTDAYGSGKVSVRASRLEEAPTELAALGAAFDRMADAVGERTRAAEAEAEARGVLLRELHHRIKNNFQLAISLISLQRRETSPEVAAALSVQERRIAAIAAAHRVSYAEGEVGPVRLAPLLREVIATFPKGRPAFRLQVTDDLPSLVLDRAVPAALLVAEVAAASAPMDGDQDTVAIAAEACGGRITVAMEGLRLARSGGFDRRLRDSCAAQLGASLEEKTVDGRAVTTITFDTELAHAEGANTKARRSAQG